MYNTKKKIMAVILSVTVLITVGFPLTLVVSGAGEEWVEITGAEATTSIRSDLSPGNLIDGKENTFWSSAIRQGEYPESGDSVTLSVNGTASISRIALSPRKELITAFPRGFKLQYSPDKKTWIDIPGQTYTDYQITPGEKVFSFAPVEAKKIRIVGIRYGTDDNGHYLMQLGGVRLYGVITAPPAPAIWGKSPIKEPYDYVSDGSFSGKEQAASPDPLVAYRWENPTADDSLEIFLRKPVSADTETPGSFHGLDSITTEDVDVRVTGPGTIRMDFGLEFAGWLEIDSPDLSGEITLGVSEYNQPAFVNRGPKSPSKTAVPVKYGNTYRVELNDELYEGARFGFINVTNFDKPFTITGVRLVCQTKPVNYEGSFDSDNEMLNKIWYTAAYDVRANLKKDYFAAIIVDRGDRHSWTGDAYTSQAAALPAFANYDFVLENLRYTAVRPNGIESYELLWILSLVDYYEYTGDKEGVLSLLDEAAKRLDHAYAIYGTNPSLGFFGWDERLGAGFENHSLPENQNSYKLLSIQSWKDFSALLAEIGQTQLADKYAGYAAEKTAQLTADPDFYKVYGLHASADAINAGVDDIQKLYHKDFDDRLNRLSYSPFNQYMLLQAMSKAGKYDDAISAVLDLWGGQISYGGTTFFETFRPGWNDIIGQNDPVPNNQSGYTSLAHPWSAGVLAWLSEEVLGIKSDKAGFESFVVKPHLGRHLTRVSGEMPTPHGAIEAAFDTETGRHTLNVPVGTTAVIGIPKVEKHIAAISVNGVSASAEDEDDGFIYFKNLRAGSYTFQVTYEGETPVYVEKDYVYSAEFVKMDTVTKGNWGGVYGADGYLLPGYNGNDVRVLPDYVRNIRLSKGRRVSWASESMDDRALSSNPFNAGSRAIGAYHSDDSTACYQTFTVDIDLREQREYTVALYFADWDGQGRELMVEMFDGETLNLVAPLQSIHDYTGGVYLVYKYNKSSRFRINHIRGINATLSGIFLGEGSGSSPAYSTELVDDQDARVNYTGSWNHHPLGDAYNGTFSYSGTSGASAELTFTGIGISYIASMENNRGIAEVFFDGVSRGKFDLYSTGVRRQEMVFADNNLRYGEHTIKIVVTGEKNPLALNSYVDIDAFEVRNEFQNIQVSKVDDQNSPVTYGGSGWTHDPIEGAYQGTFSYSNQKNDLASLAFTGTGISYIASKESNRGIAEIFIDEESKGKIDLYSSKTLRQQEVFRLDGLAEGNHTIKVVVTGEKNSASAGAYVDIDAFEIRKSLFSVGMIADNLSVQNPKPGDTALTMPKVPAGFTVSVKESGYPKVLSLDGNITAPDIDMAVKVTFTVSDGKETADKELYVMVPGRDHTKSTEIFDDPNSQIVYQGGPWNHDPGNGTLWNTFSYSNVTGASATLTFTGTGVTYAASKESNRGIAEIWIDGVSEGRIDLYAAQPEKQAEVFSVNDLSPGIHTMQIVVTGEKNNASSGTYVDVDAIYVESFFRNQRTDKVDDRDASVVYDGGGWTHDTVGGGYNQTFSYHHAAGTHATLHFTGTGVSYIASKEGNRGIAEVILDGQSQGTFDLYSASTRRQQVIFSVDGLENTGHTLQILVTGQKNPASSGSYVDIDCFDVRSPILTAMGLVDQLTLKPPAKGEDSLWLPKLPAGFQLSIQETSHPGILGSGGEVTCPEQDTEVTVTLEVRGSEICGKTMTVMIPGVGHDWDSDFTVDKEPTCTQSGSKSIHCKTCDERKEVTVIPATGHNYGEWKVVIAATCTVEGRMERTCSTCGDKEFQAIAASHDWDSDFTVDKEPTCTQSGSKSIHCKNCDERKEITAIPATGHNYGEWKIVIEATCTVEGRMERTCSTCGDKEFQAIPASHDWDSDFTVDKEPTCTQSGSKSIHCKNCDEQKEVTVIPATGHNYGEWKVVIEATVETEGRKERVCSYCGEVETATIPKLEDISQTESTSSEDSSQSEQQTSTLSSQDPESSEKEQNSSREQDWAAPPKTGDTRAPMAIMALLLACAGVCVAVKKRR